MRRINIKSPILSADALSGNRNRYDQFLAFYNQIDHILKSFTESESKLSIKRRRQQNKLFLCLFRCASKDPKVAFVEDVLKGILKINKTILKDMETLTVRLDPAYLEQKFNAMQQVWTEELRKPKHKLVKMTDPDAFSDCHKNFSDIIARGIARIKETESDKPELSEFKKYEREEKRMQDSYNFSISSSFSRNISSL